MVRHRRTGAVRAGQRQRHAIDPWLARVLDAVGVGVVPDEVADRHRLVHAGIDRVVCLARRERHHIALASGGVRIAIVACRTASCILRTEHISARQSEPNIIRARR